MPDTLERRADDARIGRVESKVDILADNLRQHIVDESAIFMEFKGGIERLAVTAEQHTKVLDKVSETLESIANQNVRLSMTEMQTEQHGKHLYDLQRQVDEQDDAIHAGAEKTDRIYWIAGIAGTVLGAAWAVISWWLK